MAVIGERWRRLEVWQLADDLAAEIYQATQELPREERFGLVAQLRRAALSVPTNIVEGYARRGDRELTRFLSIALGSLAETKYLLHFSRRMGYLSEGKYNELQAACQQVGQRLWRFYEAVGKSEKAETGEKP
ncbi:MAG: four helix bundle protein [Caldilineae bacterium]|nr:MAG: four helix bundle protein [Caldilineae bacterium]